MMLHDIPDLPLGAFRKTPDGRLMALCKGGGGGGAEKYDNLEDLYKEQADSARMLRQLGEKNLPGVTRQYMDQVATALDSGYADRQAGQVKADMVAANGMERQASQRQLQAMGINPNDPRYARSLHAGEVNHAAKVAAGQNIARNEAKNYQLNVAKDAVGTFTGQSNNAAAQASSATGGLSSLYNQQQNAASQQQANQQNAISNAVGGAMTLGSVIPSLFKDGGRVRSGTARAHGVQARRARAMAEAQAARQRYAHRPVGGPADRLAGGQGRGRAFDLRPLPRQGGVAWPGRQVEHHFLGGKAGSQQGGFMGGGGGTPAPQMKSVGAPGAGASSGFQGMAQMGKMVAQTTAKGGGSFMQGMANQGGAIMEGAGNLFGSPEISAYGKGMALSPDQAGAARDAYLQASQASQAAGDSAMAAQYENIGNSIAQGAGVDSAIAQQAVQTGAQTAGETMIGSALGEAGGAAIAETGSAVAAEAMGTSALTSGLGAVASAIPWLGAAYAVGSLLDIFADGGKVNPRPGPGRRVAHLPRPKKVQDLRNGNKVPGKWVENRDTVPALLVEEEGVLNVEAMALLGDKAFKRLNEQGLRLRQQGYTPGQIRNFSAYRKAKEVGQ